MKSQINSQILVYILAVIIMALVLAFGYKAINDMKVKAADIELITFRSNIQTEISKLAPQYETINVLSLKIPTKFREICFVDLNFATRPGGNEPSIPDTYPVIRDLVPGMLNGVEQKNLFLCPKCTDQLYVGNIIIKDESDQLVGFRCFPVRNGIIKLTVKGRGNGVTIY
jgi:hypothetical protein